MSDTSGTEDRQIPPDRDFIWRPPGPYDRLPVLREDDEIENEVLSEKQPPFANNTTISRRTNSEIPRYLTKAYYSSWGRPQVSFIADKKGERVCEREYLHEEETRSLRELYDKAEDAFSDWWDHLEDDAEEREADENSVKEEYVEAFIRSYEGQLSALDRQHPDRREEYEKAREGYVESVKKFGRLGGAPYTYYDFTEYYINAPRWKQNIAADGRKGGLKAAEEDIEIGIGLRDDAGLDKLARERFKILWDDLVLGVHSLSQDIFDFPGLRMIHIHNFKKAYTERTAGGQVPTGTNQTGARIVSTSLDGDARVYLIEIDDPEHLSEPAQVEVSVRPTGDPE